jgi:non-ribosomal peptide synthetase component E (peptide arylation enzyme)
VFVAEQLPVLATGKIDKKALRARYAGQAREDD